jgi:tripartite-type tricarboxylate transporter receptor subunit TctC
MRTAALILAAAIGALTPAQAQDWPAKTVRIVVPFGPGSTPDIVARLLGEQLQAKYPGSAFVIENKPGAGGNTGTDAVAKAAPDGATIGVSIGGPLAINTILFSKLPYDPKKDIAPVTQLVTMPSALAVHPDLGVKNVADLIALLKKEPGKYNFGSIGNGSLSHLTMEAIAQKSGAQLVHIPYPSSPAAMTALVRGDVHMTVLPAIAVTPQADVGKVNILAVSLPKRSPYLSNIPTLKEAGIDVELFNWRGVFAPPDISAEDKAAMVKLMEDMTKSAAWAEECKNRQWTSIPLTGDAYEKFLKEDIARIEGILKDLGLA